MRSTQLHEALTEFVGQAAELLQAEIDGGAEVPFELEQRGRRHGAAGPGLATYRPLTHEFIGFHEEAIERLAAYQAAAMLLADFDGLERYLAQIGAEAAGRTSAPRLAMTAVLCDVFAEQTDFEIHAERIDRALGRLERSALERTSEATLVATLHGLTTGSEMIQLTRGLTIAQPHALDGLPAPAREGVDDGPGHLVAVLNVEDEDPGAALPRARAILADLLRSLRLFGDGRVTLGPLAWARIGTGAWTPVALGTGGRPHGMLVVTPEQEDELRGFCNLVSRRAPDGNEIAWALARYELGCERTSPFEGLSDHLLALRALLEPEGVQSGMLPVRLAALCATRERWEAFGERTAQAAALERALIAGTADAHTGALALAQEMADSLRALLRDVICGHLDSDLATLADDIIRDAAEEAEREAAAIEAERVAAEESARAAREAALAAEAERVAAQEAERTAALEAEHVTALEAERAATLEAERVATLEAERSAEEEADRTAVQARSAAVASSQEAPRTAPDAAAELRAVEMAGSAEFSFEQIFGDVGESGEVLDVFI